MGQQRSPDFRLHTRKELDERLYNVGVSWFMETDKFGFKVYVKDGPCTRHGILSIVIAYMILWE